jgi:hypothetical protein
MCGCLGAIVVNQKGGDIFAKITTDLKIVNQFKQDWVHMALAFGD